MSKIDNDVASDVAEAPSTRGAGRRSAQRQPVPTRAAPEPTRRASTRSAAAEPPAARMLAVLEAVAQFDEPVAAVDLIPRLQLPRATVHRIAVTLERLGYLHREPGSKRFTIGFRQQRLALASLINSATRGARHAILQSLVADVGETCNVTVLDGNEVAYIDRVESDWPLRTHLQPGSRVPIHCGASGMMFLSAMPASKRRAILRSAPLRKFTDKTVIDPDRIEENLRQIRRNDVAIEVEEFMQGLIGLAVPVRDRTGRLCATVSMHAPTARFTVEQVLAQVPALRKAAAAVEQLLDPVDQSANARDANEVKRSGARGATRSARVTDKR